MCTGHAQRPAYSGGRPTESTPLSGGGRSTGLSTVGSTVRPLAGRPEGQFCTFQTANGQIFERLYICLLFDLDFNIYLEIFPSVFLCSKHFIFSHLSYLSILSIRILFYEKNWFVFVETTKSCNLPCICCYLSCVEVIVEIVFGCVGIPLNVEVIMVGVALCLSL